ncbi:MAG TPA: penicillin-binding protein 2 [Thermoanaerobaculia bacterium]|nr:penicillin-binding protein 2 [Thermoanaerobaculia bacterium]
MRIYRIDQKLTNTRINILMWSMVVIFVFLTGAFWRVQAVQADRFRGLSESNALREVKIRAKRGLITDRNGKILADTQPAYSLVLSRADLRQFVKADPEYRGRMIQFVARTVGVEESVILERIDKGRKIPFNQPLPLAEELTVSQVAEIQANKLKFPMLEVDPVMRRNYRYGTMAAHVLGFMAEATEKDMAEDPDLKLRDLIGKKGVERVYDGFLRGRDGAKYMVVDTHGRSLEEYAPLRREPVPGKNVTLTLDFELQRRAEQYFIENEMVGAAVALDPRSGEVLAMVSSPAFNPNVYSRRFTPEVWKTLISNPFKIEVNRAISGLYSPGSIFKNVMAMAGLEYGVVTPSTTFHCGGSDAFFGRRFRCWKREGHGAVSLERALKISCDIYFYNVGARLGVDRIKKYAQNLTFGEISRIDLEGEKAGLLPSEEWALTKRKSKWYRSETISVSIGQGPVIVTVLQTANMMAAIANGGKVYRPHVLKTVEDVAPDGSVTLRRVVPEVIHEVHLAPAALKAVRSGLWKVVNEAGGTGGRSRIEGLDVAGKTGTVQVIAQHGWVRSESLPFKFRDHAWFAAMAPHENAQMVVVVFVEHGGHGGADAAPLAKVLFESRFRDRIATKTLDLQDPETLKKLKEGRLPAAGETPPSR